MFIGAILVCASMYNVSTCDVRMSTHKAFESKEECIIEMKAAAQFAAKNLGLVSRPFCFPTKEKLT